MAGHCLEAPAASVSAKPLAIRPHQPDGHVVVINAVADRGVPGDVSNVQPHLGTCPPPARDRGLDPVKSQTGTPMHATRPHRRAVLINARRPLSMAVGEAHLHPPVRRVIPRRPTPGCGEHDEFARWRRLRTRDDTPPDDRRPSQDCVHARSALCTHQVRQRHTLTSQHTGRHVILTELVLILSSRCHAPSVT
jgi:hypothetical protein